MTHTKNRLWIVMVLIFVLVSFIITGAWGLYHDWTSITSYALLGLGLGGGVAGWGAWLDGRNEQKDTLSVPSKQTPQKK